MEKPIFDYDSNFNPKANAGSIRFGANAPVLEVELNELQHIQDKAREDLIRSTIPSGFTKPVEINFEDIGVDYSKLKVNRDAEAYVNGMRIHIPRGTVIDIGDSPTTEPREDLVFLEVWKEVEDSTSVLAEYGGEGQPATPNNMIDPRVNAETSRRVINKWRIRCVQGLDFDFTGHESTIADCPDKFIGWLDDKKFSKVYAKGAVADLPIPNNIQGREIFRSADSNWLVGSSLFNDPTLWIAGVKGETLSINRYKTVDGLVYAIPMFRLHRRPNRGFTTGDFSNISPIADPVKVAKLLESTKKISTATGDLELKAEGKMFINIIPDRDTYDDGHTGWDKPTNSGYISASEANIPFYSNILAPNTDYTLVFDAFIQGFDASKGKILYADLFPDNFPEIGWVSLTDTRTRYAFNFRTPSDLTGLETIRFYSGANTNVLLIKEVMLFEGTYTVETAPKNFFKGVSAVGDNAITLDKFIPWSASITKGVAQDVIAEFPVTLNDPYLQVVPVDDKGKEIISGEIAYALLRDGQNVGWNAVNGKIRYDNFWKIQRIKVWCNNVAPTCKIKGFNIYTGGNLLVTANNLDSTKESVLNLKLNEPIRSINGRPDLTFGDGRVVRRVRKLVLDDKCAWGSYVLTSTDGKHVIFQLSVPSMARTKLMSNIAYVNIYGDDHSRTFNREYVGIYKGDNTSGEWLYLCIESSKLTHPYVPDLKEYLKNKPMIVYYEDKNTISCPELPNGIKDVDDYNGNITRNVGVIEKPYNLAWGFDPGVTQTESCMRFCVSITDKKDVGTSSGNDVYCEKIPTLKKSETVTALPRIWSWWGRSIYIDVNASMIGCNFSSDSNETKVEKFKQWLSYRGEIYYEKAQPVQQTYVMDYAEVEGNLVLDEDKYKINIEGTTQPELHLYHSSNLNLNINEGINYVYADTQISPSEFSIGEHSSSDRILEFNSDSENDNVPVVIQGNTLQNFVGTKYKNAGGTWSEDTKTFVVDSNNLPEGFVVDFRVPLVEEGVKYTAICKLSNLSQSVKDDGFQIGILTDNNTWNTNGAVNGVQEGYIKFLLRPTVGVSIAGIRFRNKSSFASGTQVNATLSDFMLLKGDWTQKEVPKYFCGLSSVGEMEINLFDKTLSEYQKATQLGEAKAVYFKLKPNTQYICSSNVPQSSKNSMIYFNKPTTQEGGVWKGNPRVVGTDDTGMLYIAIRNTNYVDGQSMEDFFNGKYYIRLQEGTSPMDKVVTGKYKLGVVGLGKNLCPINTFSTSEGRKVITKIPIQLEEYTDYYAYCDKNLQLAVLLSNVYVEDYTNNHDVLYTKVVRDGHGTEIGFGTDGTINFNSQGFKYAYITTWIMNENGVDISKLMLCKKKDGTSYEPYKGKSSFILASEPLRGLDNTRDIAQEVSGRAEITRVWAKLVLDNKLRWKDPESDGTYTKMSLSNFPNMKYGSAVICDSLNQRIDGAGLSIQKEYIATTTNPYYSFVLCLKVPNQEQFLKRLEQKPIEIFYQLDTPKVEVANSYLDSSKGTITQVNISKESPTDVSGIDCGYFSVTDSNLVGEWKTNQAIVCTYEYPYGNMEDLVGKPLATDFGYKDETQYRYLLLELLPNNKCVIQNIGKPNPSAIRAFTLHSSVSTRMNEESTFDLQKRVSLTGNDYNTVLERETCEHLY